MRLLFRLIALAGIMAAAVFVGRSLLPADSGTAGAEAPQVRVRIASRNLPVGTFLDETEAPFTEWSEPVNREMVEDPVPQGRDVIGAVIIAPIQAGEPVRRSHLLLPGQDGFLAAVLQAGMRAVSVAVDAVSGNAGHIFPGDRVDLILTQTLNQRDLATPQPDRWASETILRDVRVIAVDQNLRSDMTQRDPSGIARTITLEVMPQDAEKVALASGLGRLSLSLRSLLVDESKGATTAAGDSPRVAELAEQRPTWGSDVSAVIRGATQVPEKAPSLPPAASVRVFRGKAINEVTQ
tara:strand:+ start:65 stop:949 length:885 start_codon:yes stop_codon:yes gene_type:complete